MKRVLIFLIFLLISISVIFSQQDNSTEVKGKYFSMFLPNTWHKTDSHMVLDQIIAETGISQSNVDSVFNCYVDSQNYYNVLIVGERIHSKRTLKGVTIEQLIQRPGEKKEYNGLEFLITTDSDNFYPSLSYIGANAIYEDATFYFLFVLNNENIYIADQTLSSISFIDIKKEKKDGFFIGIWHGIRSPFVFIINIFKKEDIVLFSKSRNIGYIIGFILAFPIGIFVFSSIFGSSRRRNY